MKLLLSVLFSVITKGLLIGQMNVPQQAPADRISEKDNRVFITGLEQGAPTASQIPAEFENFMPTNGGVISCAEVQVVVVLFMIYNPMRPLMIE